MTGRIGVFLGVAPVVVCVAASVDLALKGSPVAYGFAAMAAAWAGIAIHDWKLNRKDSHGSDRQAEAGSSDPGAFTYSVNPNSYTVKISSPFGSRQELMTKTEEIERVESDMPILAHRVASLRFDGSKDYWGAVNQRTHFGVDADARCNGRWRITSMYDERPNVHESPSLDCDCGFYALPSDVEPWADTANWVTLMVELSGTVIEHDKGYRAGHQRVVECQLPACPYCGRKAECVDVRGGKMHEAVCGAHVPAVVTPPQGQDHRLLSLADVEALLPVPVTRAGS